MARYSDAQLTSAIASANSWRSVLRELGLPASSSSAARSARRAADRIGADYKHFRGKRGWTTDALVAAVSRARSWAEVASEVGLPEQKIGLLKGHAARLGIDVEHLSPTPTPCTAGDRAIQPRIELLPRAGTLLAATWFEFSGQPVSWPLEPSRYDLLAWCDGRAERIQVKTTRTRSGASWKVFLSTTGRERRAYSPDEVDQFFVIDGDLNFYLLPIQEVGGLHAIHVAAYEQFRVPGFPVTA